MTSDVDWDAVPRKRIFDEAELRARAERVRAVMARRGVDALVVTDPSNAYYLTGYDTLALHDFIGVVVPLDDEPSVVINEFHEGLYHSLSGYWPARLFGEFDDPVETVLAILSAGSPRTVALDAARPRELARLRERLDGASVVDAFGLIEDVRVVKSDAEIEHMRRVAATTDAGAEAAMGAIAEGVHDHEVATAAISAMLASGAEFPATCPIVCGGYRGGIPYSTFDGYRLKAGDAVFVEQTGSIRRYAAPLMRTGTVGEASAEVALAGRVTSQAVDVIMATARDGVSSREVAEAAMAVLHEGLAGRAFHNVIGYPVGIAYPPTWVEPLGYTITVKSDFELRRGMTFHLPMSLRKPGEWAVGLSQTIVVGDRASAPLGSSPARLFEGALA